MFDTSNPQGSFSQDPYGDQSDENLDKANEAFDEARRADFAQAERDERKAYWRSKAVVAFGHRMIAIAYRFKTGPGRRDYLNRCALTRIRELERYLAHRYCPDAVVSRDGQILYIRLQLPDDDAARHDLVILLNHIAQNKVGAYAKMKAAAVFWAPWMSRDEMDEIITRILIRPRRYSAKKLGELTRLTEHEHAELGITSWWPHTWEEDKVRADQKQRKQTKDRETKKAKRRRAGAVPRKEYEATSKTRTKPWIVAGYKCRRTWERHMKKADAEKCRNSVASIREDSYRSDTLATSPIGVINMPAADLTNVVFLSARSISISKGVTVPLDLKKAA